MSAAFEKEITIRFWFNTSDELENLTGDERDMLEEQAKESIFRFITEDGYTSGELCESINDKEFYGWWEYRIINK